MMRLKTGLHLAQHIVPKHAQPGDLQREVRDIACWSPTITPRSLLLRIILLPLPLFCAQDLSGIRTPKPDYFPECGGGGEPRFECDAAQPFPCQPCPGERGHRDFPQSVLARRQSFAHWLGSVLSEALGLSGLKSLISAQDRAEFSFCAHRCLPPPPLPCHGSPKRSLAPLPQSWALPPASPLLPLGSTWMNLREGELTRPGSKL